MPSNRCVSAATTFCCICNKRLSLPTRHRRRCRVISLSFSFDPRWNDLNTARLMRAVILAVLLNGFFSLAAFGAGRAEHIVVVVWDGMRPDFITEQDTPTLNRLARE